MEPFSRPLAVQFYTTSFNVCTTMYPLPFLQHTHLYITHTCTGRFAKSPYYQQSVEALRRHQLACRLLGEPLRFQTLRLGDQRNWVTTEEAHVRRLIPHVPFLALRRFIKMGQENHLSCSPSNFVWELATMYILHTNYDL